MQTSKTALDVHELLRAQIGAESCFRHDVISQLESMTGRPYTVAPVSNVGERATVNEYRVAFECLHQIRLHRILQQGAHCVHCP
ncbi:hypothetical protein D3C78_1167100 [compost metagenome]